MSCARPSVPSVRKAPPDTPVTADNGFCVKQGAEDGFFHGIGGSTEHSVDRIVVHHVEMEDVARCIMGNMVRAGESDDNFPTAIGDIGTGTGKPHGSTFGDPFQLSLAQRNVRRDDRNDRSCVFCFSRSSAIPSPCASNQRIIRHPMGS